MISKAFADVTSEDIKLLIDSEITEGRSIEFKLVLPGGTEGERKEFLADVSSFANTVGGDLLFGIREEQSAAVEAVGVSLSNVDAEIRRLDDLVRTGVAPRIPGLRIRSIDGFSKGPVLLLRIPRSWAAPHMVCLKNTSRFYARNNKGKYQLDVAEIRAAFVLSESVPERIREFRMQRLAQIDADETPVRLLDNPKVVLHIVPLSSFSNPMMLAPAELRSQQSHLGPPGIGGGFLRYNMDGIVMVTSEDEPACRAYCQAYRSGIVEAVDAKMIRHGSDKVIPSTSFEEELIHSVRDYFMALTEWNIAPPFFMFLSLLGFEGYAMAAGRAFWNVANATIDRRVVALPEVLVEDPSRPIQQIIRPVLDMAWNAAGRPGSPNFDDEGNWNSDLSR